MRFAVLIAIGLIGWFPLSASDHLHGWCEQGNQSVSTQGLSSTTKVQRSYPSCTVTVYNFGTLTPSTIFSDNVGTPLANPFTAKSDGSWDFYVADGRYDVQVSGGGMSSPLTYQLSSAIDPYFTQSGSGAVSRLKNDKLKDTISVKDFGASCDGLTNDTTPIQSAINSLASGGTVLFPAGTCVLNSGLTGTAVGITLQGTGKGSTILSYTGSGDAFTWSGLSNKKIALKHLRINGTTAATNGVVFSQLQDWVLDHVVISGFSKVGAAALKIFGANTGLSINSDYQNSYYGVYLTNNLTQTPNLNSFIGGQMVSNTANAVYSDASGQSNLFHKVNIASNTGSPAVFFLKGTSTVDGCFFEANHGGANTYSIQLGDAANAVSGVYILNNYFTEGDAGAVTYMVRVMNGNGVRLLNNHNGSTGATAFARIEANGSGTMVIGTTGPGIPYISDASGDVSTFGIGPSTNFSHCATGYCFNEQISGTTSNPLRFQAGAAGQDLARFLNDVGAQKAKIDNSGVAFFTDVTITTPSGLGGHAVTTDGAQLMTNKRGVFLGNGNFALDWGDTSALGRLTFSGINPLNPLISSPSGGNLMFSLPVELYQRTYLQMIALTVNNGAALYCTDCNATCTAGGGTGRTCFRENGAWTH